MLRIFYEESRCDSKTILATRQENSHGAFQLNLRQHRWITERCAHDDLCAARAARKVFEWQGFSAWTKYAEVKR